MVCKFREASYLLLRGQMIQTVEMKIGTDLAWLQSCSHALSPSWYNVVNLALSGRKTSKLLVIILAFVAL